MSVESHKAVLGPLFFLLYVNDMVRASKNFDLDLFAVNTVDYDFLTNGWLW